MFTLLLLAACGTGITVGSEDPGHDIDGDGIPDDVDTDNNTDETDIAYLVAGKTATWNFDTHKVENIQNLEDVAFTMNDPDETNGFTEAQVDIKIGEWTTNYSYTMGDFTFTGDVTKDMEDSTDFTGELDTIEGLEGTKLSCDGTLYSDPFNTSISEIDKDEHTYDVDGLSYFRANGPLFTTDNDDAFNALLTDTGFYFAGFRGDDPFYVECTFR